jgi:hypothetical protein
MTPRYFVYLGLSILAMMAMGIIGIVQRLDAIKNALTMPAGSPLVLCRSTQEWQGPQQTTDEYQVMVCDERGAIVPR